MRKLSICLSSLVISVLISGEVLAMCTAFWVPGRVFEPATNMKSLFIENNSEKTLVVQPEFSGNATEFALIMPFTSQPELSEVDKRLFDRLEDFTNPETSFTDDCFDCGPTVQSLGRANEEIVQVLEERVVGDFQTTTLSAESADALIQYLDENQYEITDDKRRTINYFVDNNYKFFTALKVDMTKAVLDSEGNYIGTLDPIAFTYSSEENKLPLRIMGSDTGGVVELIVYTLSDKQLYIAGSEMQYAKKVGSRDIKDAGIDEYADKSDWLVRNKLQVEVSEVQTDLQISESPQDVIVDENNGAVRLNPDLLDDNTGIIPARNGVIRYITESSVDGDNKSNGDNEDKTDSEFDYLLPVILLGGMNLILLGLLVVSNNKKKV